MFTQDKTFQPLKLLSMRALLSMQDTFKSVMECYGVGHRLAIGDLVEDYTLDLSIESSSHLATNPIKTTSLCHWAQFTKQHTD